MSFFETLIDYQHICSLQSPEPTKPPLPPKRGISSMAGSSSNTSSSSTWKSSNPNLATTNSTSWASESLKLQSWEQTSRSGQEGTSSLHIFGSPLVRQGVKKVLVDEEEEDCNSDTGLSSLNSSADDQFQLDTLV